MAGDQKEIGEVELIDAGDMHREVTSKLDAQRDTLRDILSAVRFDGCEIVCIAANGSSSEYPKLRIALLIFAAKTAGDVTLTVGARSFAFTVPAQPVAIPFPLVIERGIAVGYTAMDGNLFVVGRPE